MEVLEYMINLFKIDQFDDSALKVILDKALVYDRIDLVQWLQQRFGRDRTLSLSPTLETLLEIAKKNSLRSLEFHFNSTKFTNMTNTHKLRTIHSIINKCYKSGLTRVIKLCADLIATISHQSDLAPQIDTNQSMIGLDDYVPKCLHQYEKAFHSVFGNRLGMLIMEQVGVVHKSLGVEAKHVIKGAELIDRHCLNDYIKYGATEWFLKAYSPSSLATNSSNYNTVLMEMAVIKSDKRALDALLANPFMTLPAKMESLSDQFINTVSTCSHPEWERLFDQYILIMLQGTKPELDVWQFDEIQHPSFLHKLIQCGKTTPSNLEPISQVRDSMESWLSKPWAMEMIQLLDQLTLLHPDIHLNILVTAIDDDITSLFHHYLPHISTMYNSRANSTASSIHCPLAPAPAPAPP
ncbi:hypothetical protein SAMD00019534_101050 [Acytostelium subglobosum LB1]|uniref:hypothetical protein n=1 Tax=Acytostelium subglobosum LB1 TaxID=1410327 RepID=UPI000644CA46|nr:hypothetical protein SAMD00019534_101050 [Acytostelium subglobosum LB1]GAM26930.1 hypothetical protein SAMD00019534_101050 [Acytostelium subglobosum LB1]|eukprot:XP_012750198.1 hypothetical protein SAMD00019534_101050 [Acytostelium subglobosum LB1]